MGSPAKPVPPCSARIPLRCEPDPIAGWVVELLQAAHAEQRAPWPTHSRGMQALLPSDRLHRGRAGAPSAALDLQEALSRRLARQADAPRSAIQVHNELDGLIFQAQKGICTFGWFHDPAAAIFVCADQSEATKIEARLRCDYDLERSDDLLETAQWVAEYLMPPSPGWRYSGPGPVLLASEIPPGAGWREVFLSPDCRGLRADQLLPAVGAAQMGVHVMAFNKRLVDS